MNDAPASAMNTGTPASSTTMKTNAMITMGSVRCDLMRDVVGPAPADPRIAPDIDRLAHEHPDAAERDPAVDVAHRQVEHGHALQAHALGDGPGEPCEQAEETELDQIDEGEQRRARESRLHDVREKLNRDVGVAARHHDPADEHDPHQAIARDFLGPRQAVVEHVAGEELQKDDEGERPEDHEREPILRM